MYWEGIDFGAHCSYTPETQTMLYRAPELFLGLRQYHSSIDIWSIGCVFAEMIRGEPLFQGTREIELFQFILRLLSYHCYFIAENKTN